MIIAIPSKVVLKNIAYLYTSFMLNHFLRAIYLVFLARILGADLYGVIAYGQTWYTAFLSFCSLGLGSILMRQLAVDKDAGADIANQIVVIQVISVAFLTVICFSLGIGMNDETYIQKILVIYSIAFMARGICQWCESMFIAYEKPGEVLKIEKYLKPSEVFVGIIIALLTKNIFFVAVAHTFFWWLQAIIEIKIVNQKLQTIKPKIDLSNMKKMVVNAGQ